MSKFYGVLTVGEEDKPEQAVRTSRVSDNFITAEVCNESTTYRVSLYEDGSAYVDKVEKRWNDAQLVEDDEWEWLWSNEVDDETFVSSLPEFDAENDLVEEKDDA